MKRIIIWRRLKWLGLACVLVISLLFATTINIGDVPSNAGDAITLGGEDGKVINIGYPAYASETPDYICDGVDDNVQFQAALDALPAVGGELRVTAGTFNFTATVSRAIDSVTITGVGRGTSFTNDGVTPLFSAGVQSYWIFQEFRTDAGGITLANATNYRLENVYLGTEECNYVRGVTLVVAASNASNEERAQADYLCDGTADDAQIQAAVTEASTLGGTVVCTTGTFNLGTRITLAQGVSIIGQHSWGTANVLNKGTVFNCDGTDYGLYYFNGAGNQPLGVRISGIHFVHPGTGNFEPIYIDGGQHIHFQNLEFHKAPNNAYTSAAIYVANGENYWFRDVYINNTPRSGIFLALVGRCEFNNVILDDVCTGDPGAGNRYGAALLVLSSHHINITNCQFGTTSHGHHIRFSDVYQSCIRNSFLWHASYGIDGIYDNIRLEVGAAGGSIEVTGNIINQGAYANRCNYCINNACGVVRIFDNEITDAVNYRAAVVNLAGAGVAGTEFRANAGFVTENSGTATLLNGNVTVVVAHGLGITPSEVFITFAENPANPIGDWWVDTIGAANFTFNGVNPGATNLDFYWIAIYRP